MKYLPIQTHDMKYIIQVEAKAYIQIPDPEFDALFKLCAHHYDDTVRSTTKQGGFLYGSQGRRKFRKEHPSPDPENAEYTIEIEFDQRRLGLALKAIEMDMNDTCYRLSQVLWAAVRDIQKTMTDVNKQLNPA